MFPVRNFFLVSRKLLSKESIPCSIQHELLNCRAYTMMKETAKYTSGQSENVTKLISGVAGDRGYHK